MLIGVLSGLAAGALWGLVFIAPRMVPGLSSVDLTAGRFVSYGALSFVLMLLIRQSAWPTGRQALSALGLSVLGFTGYYLLLVLAIRDAGTEVPSLTIATRINVYDAVPYRKNPDTNVGEPCPWTAPLACA